MTDIYLVIFVNFFIKIIFLFNQTIIKIDIHIKLNKKNKKKYYVRLYILEILSKKNIFRSKVLLYKR